MYSISRVDQPPAKRVTDLVTQPLGMRPREAVDRNLPDVFLCGIENRVVGENVDQAENKDPVIDWRANRIDYDRAIELSLATRPPANECSVPCGSPIQIRTCFCGLERDASILPRARH